MRKLILTAVCAVALSGCATTDVAALMQAAEAYDKDCYKRTEVKVVPMLVFGWPIPIISADHVKVCNPEMANSSTEIPG